VQDRRAVGRGQAMHFVLHVGMVSELGGEIGVTVQQDPPIQIITPLGGLVVGGEDLVELFLIVDWNAFDPMKLGLALAVTLRARYPAEWKPEGILTMLGDRASYQAILEGRGFQAIESLWRAGLE